MEKTISVVVPAHNEQDHIRAVIIGLPDYVDYIVVIDDASDDATGDIVESIADPRIDLISEKQNQGVGASTIAGYKRSLELGAEIVVKVDGDGQMPIKHLPELLAPHFHGWGYSKGNRFLDRAALSQMPKSRLIGNILLTFLNKIASGCWHVFDPQNGFTAIGSETLESIDLDRIHSRYFFENDMLVEVSIAGAKVKDVPMPSRYGSEQSGIRIAPVLFSFPWLFARRFVHRIFQKYVLRDFSPIVLFLGIGLLLMSWGIGFGIFIWIRSISSQIPQSTGTVMMAALPLILGFQLFLQGIVLDIQESPR